MSTMRDRTVFITGASRGIGRAIALAAARQGASRWCLDPDRYWDADAVSGMTPEQRAVMYGPSSAPQTDGPYLDLDEDGVVKVDRDYLTSLETASDTFLRG